MPRDFPTAGLRVLVEVAQSGSFSAAGRRLGYTQSAVSRQVAALESVAGRPLFERRRDGVVLTPAGARLLARAVRVLDELDAAAREVAGPSARGPVRIGAFPAAAAGLLPGAQGPGQRRRGALPHRHDHVAHRGQRAGTLDLAVIAQTPPFRPPDAESPPLSLTVLAEDELVVGVGPGHPFAGRTAVEVGELVGQRWVASRSDRGDPLLGVWPGLAERPDVRYVVRDWHAKLQIVAAGLAVTTLAPVLFGTLPEGVRVVARRRAAPPGRDATSPSGARRGTCATRP